MDSEKNQHGLAALAGDVPLLPAKAASPCWFFHYRYGIILGFRFFYGIRTVTPFILGMTTIPSLEFLLLNGIGGIVWAVVVGSLGYAFGEATELFIGNVKSYELKLIVALFCIGVLLHYLINVYNRKS